MRISKPIAYVPLALLGIGYFVAFAGFELSPILKNQLVLLPLQVGALLYLLLKQSRTEP